MAERILIVEDDEALNLGLKIILEKESYTVGQVYTGDAGLREAQSGTYDLILLDLNLPGMDGMAVLERLRREYPDLPVIIMTARTAVDERVAGLDAGANDYVTKPFDNKELLARVRAALRTKKESGIGYEVLRYGDVRLDTRSQTVTLKDRPVELAPTAFNLLAVLLRRQGTVMTREQLLNEVWGYDYNAGNVVDVYVRNLRSKLGEDLIVTKRGKGYGIGIH